GDLRGARGRRAADVRAGANPSSHSTVLSVLTMALTIFDEHVPGPIEQVAGDHLVLPFERRQIARQRVKLASGREIAVVLPRGTVLRGGDLLRCRSGEAIAVVAAPEELSTVYCKERRKLARLAYHLGNRHVALEVGDGW